MKINRNQEVGSAPDWFFSGTQIEAYEKNQKLLQAGVDRINITSSSCVDDNCLYNECQQIEKCASSGENFFYNSTWHPNHISHLKEYASICGLSHGNMIAVDPTSYVQEKQASSKEMVKTASVQTASRFEIDLKSALGDPFKLEDIADMSHMERENWEKVTPQSNIGNHPPATAMIGGILPLRGGEDTRISNQEGLARNQNSIVDPGALDRLWSSKEEGSGERLSREARERLEVRKNNHSKWESEKVAQMEADGFKAQGVVFPTEVGNVGSGISSSFMGAYSDADLMNLPDRTAGEDLASQNEYRKASIQRGSKVENEQREWDRIKEAPSRMVSDHFTDELKKRLGK